MSEAQPAVVPPPRRTLRERAPDGLQPSFRADFEAAGSDADRLRVVVDQVASLTDASAVAWHARLA